MGRKKTAPPSRSVRIHEDVYRNALIVANYEGKDLPEFVSALLRPLVEAALLKHAERTISEKGKGKGKNPPAL